MDTQYVAGFFDGDGSVCIGKCPGGFQLKVEITQCNKVFIDDLVQQYGGKTYVDTRLNKYSKESAMAVRLCGPDAYLLLNILQDLAIIKGPQAQLALEYLSHHRQQGAYPLREKYYDKMKNMNKDKSSYSKDYSRISDAYIAGLFDAEGNVYYKKYGVKKNYYVKITQKSDPVLCSKIQEYLGFGNISSSEPYRLRFHSKEAIKHFWDRVKPFIRIKRDSYVQLLINLDLPC